MELNMIFFQYSILYLSALLNILPDIHCIQSGLPDIQIKLSTGIMKLADLMPMKKNLTYSLVFPMEVPMSSQVLHGLM